MKITSKELRKKWLDFYKEIGHVDIGAVSLIGDGTTVLCSMLQECNLLCHIY